MHRMLVLLFVAAMVLGCQREKPQAPIGGGGQAPINFDSQIKLLKDVLHEDPNNLPALIKLGNYQMDSGKYKEAIESYSKALELDPKNVNIRVDMGTCYRYSGRPDKAVEEFRKAISIDPKHLYAHRNLGVTLASDLGDRAGAIKALEEYLKLSPNAPDAFQTKQEIDRLKQMAPK